MSWIEWASAISPLTAYATLGEWGGENGILTKVFSHIPAQAGFCVEFGQSAIGSGTVAKLIGDKGWGALYFDRAAKQAIQRAPTSNGRGITLAQESVSALNINTLFEKHNVPTNLDCLVIDIDGQDFWVWQAIDNKYRPSVVILEYNAHIPQDIPASIRPDPDWEYLPSKDYGASFAALCWLAVSKGYRLLHIHGCWNLFFIRNDLAFPQHLEVRLPMSREQFEILADTTGFYDALCGEGKRPSWFGQPDPNFFASPWVLVNIYEDDGGLKCANECFRAREYGKALVSYLDLYRHRPLQMYLDNAQLSASRLGCDVDTEILARTSFVRA